MDDFRGSCGGGKYPLLSAIAAVFGADQSPRRSSYVDNDFDEIFSSGTSRRGGSRDVDGPWRVGDRELATTTRRLSSRGRDRPVYSVVDDDDYHSADLDSRDDLRRGGRPSAESGLRRQQRRRQQSPELDDVTSGRSSRRRTTLAADDRSDSFRRHDDVDDGGRRSGLRSDDTFSKRRGWSERTADRGRKTFGSDGRQGTSQASPDDGWTGKARVTSSSSSSFVEEDSFQNNRRAGGVDRRDRFSSSRTRTADDYNDVPIHGRFR